MRINIRLIGLIHFIRARTAIIKVSIEDMQRWHYWREDSRNTERILKSICNSFSADFDLDDIKDTLAKVG
jgi:hypothetical protein